MNKCPKCGTEFEGKFCPECGEAWNEQKTCPNCGATLAGGAKFCNECGYSFSGKPAAGKESIIHKAKKWITDHKKQTMIAAIALVAVLLFAVVLPVSIATRYNGTYYLYTNEEYQYDTYFKLKGKKMLDEKGNAGNIVINKGQIAIYTELFGEKVLLGKGTIKNGVMTFGTSDTGTVYAKKGKMHSHNYSAWVVESPSTCKEQGTEIRACKKCGKTDTRSLDYAEHTVDDKWQMDITAHWQICSVCDYTVNYSAHNEGSAICICGIPLQDTTGLEFTPNEDRTGYILTGMGTATTTSIRLPSTYNNLPVVGIQGKSNTSPFNKNMKIVILPNSITFIGESAFKGCNELTRITIPSSVTSIGEQAFDGCKGLTAVHISNLAAWCKIHFYDYHANPLFYAHNLYLNNTLVTEITIPNSVTSIEDRAFYGCSRLTSVIIPNSVASIGKYAFADCTSLTSITIPNSVTSIGSSAFSSCSSLTSFTIPQSITSIEKGTFQFCYMLKNITIGNNVTFIGEYAFRDCNALTSVIFENTEGWKAGDTAISSSDLANSTTAARYLKSTYRNYTWTRSDD